MISDFKRERVQGLLALRQLNDIQIAERTGVNQSAVLKIRRKMGLPALPRTSQRVPPPPAPEPLCPITKYFDEAYRAWVSVYKVMYACGIHPPETARLRATKRNNLGFLL